MEDMMPRLIGLTGAAGCGKDTLADHISHVHQDTPYFRYSFAKPIKQMISTLLGVPLEKWDDREWKESDDSFLQCSPRRLAQTLGTEWGRDVIHRDIWLLCAAKAYRESVTEGGGGMIISDVRFPNEAEWIHERGGVVVRIERPLTTKVESHLSENGLPDELVDATVMNTETLGVLLSRGYIAVLSLGL